MPNLAEYLPVVLDAAQIVTVASLVVLCVPNWWMYHREGMILTENQRAILLHSADFAGGASLQRVLSSA